MSRTSTPPALRTTSSLVNWATASFKEETETYWKRFMLRLPHFADHAFGAQRHQRLAGMVGQSGFGHLLWRRSAGLFSQRRQNLLGSDRCGMDPRADRIVDRVADGRSARYFGWLAQSGDFCVRVPTVRLIHDGLDLRGHVLGAGDLVEFQVRIHHAAGDPIEDALLHQSISHALDDAADHLALAVQLIDHASGVVDRNYLEH